VTFTPPANNGGSSITGYTVTAMPGGATATGASSPITVSGLTNGTAYTFNVTATNSIGTGAASATSNRVTPLAMPQAAPKSVTTAFDTATSINLSSVITGTNIQAVTVSTLPNHGTVSVSGETVTYTPAATFYGGTDSFAYTATNAIGTSAPATVTITVSPPTAPTVTAKSVSTSYNTAATIDLSGVISGTDITTVTLATTPSHGTASVSGKTVTYTPAPSFYGGTDSFTYIATNPGGTSTAATISVTVAGPAAPTVSAKSMTTAYNTAATIDLSSAITGVDITAVTVASAPSHGTASVSGETVTYTPAPGFYGGTDTFTYTATNASGSSSPATVTVTVGHPAAPTVAAKSITTPYNTATSIDLSGSIIGVDITAVTLVSAPGHGAVSVSGKTVIYTPAATFYGGTDTFTYTATNPGGTSQPATVTVAVTPLSVPTAQALSVTTTTGVPVLIQATTGATGPQPPTGVNVAALPTHGSVSISGEQMTYTPATGFIGTDTFTYQVGNHFGLSSPATITVTVTSAGSTSGPTRTVTVAPSTAVSVQLGSIVPVISLRPSSAFRQAVPAPSSWANPPR
jgi:hypothetical protein